MSTAQPQLRPGYGKLAVENDLHGLGVRTVVIPRKGRPGNPVKPKEHRRAFRGTVKWRTGSKARISTIKRSTDGIAPASTISTGADLGRTRRPRPQPGQDRSKDL
jgi:transposase, IS5 family